MFIDNRTTKELSEERIKKARLYKKTQSYSDRDIMFHKEFQKAMKGDGVCCLFGECSKKTIKAHCFSRTMLKKISVDNHVYTMESRKDLNKDYHDFLLNKVGVGKASIFRGFCKEHDNIFCSLDNKGEIITIRDIIIQFYRIISKNYLISRTIEDSAYSASLPLPILYINGKLSIKTERLLSLFNDLIIDFDELEKDIPQINNGVYLLKPFNKIEKDFPYRIIYKKSNIKIPIILQKTLLSKNGDELYNEYLSILPIQEGISILILCKDENINRYRSLIKDNIDILCFIEKLFIMDSEWYLSPEVVSIWSDKKKELIKNDCFFSFYELNLFENEYDFSIFDEVRRDLIKCIPIERRIKEESKMDIDTIILKRKNFNERIRNMEDKTIRDSIKLMNPFNT